MRQPTRNECVLTIAIAVIGLVAFYRVGLAPWRARSAELSRRIAETKTQALGDEQAYEQLARQTTQNHVAPLIDQFDQSNDRFSRALTDFTREGQVTPLHLKRISTGKPVSLADYVRTPVSLDLDGAFPDIGKFLERLGELPILTEVESLEIYRVEDDLKKCSARIKLLSYVAVK